MTSISSILKFGIFVTLPNTIDGLIRNKDLVKLGFSISQDGTKYINRKNKDELTLGMEVRIKVIKACKKYSEIDFELLYNNIAQKNKNSIHKKGNKGNRGKNKNYRK